MSGGWDRGSWSEVAGAVDPVDAEAVLDDATDYLAVAAVSHGAVTPAVWGDCSQDERKILARAAARVHAALAEASARVAAGPPAGSADPVPAAPERESVERREVIAEGDPFVLDLLRNLEYLGA